MDAFEAAIEAFAGAEALDNYIATLNGTPGPKVGGVQLPRDYSGADGRKRAALDMVSDRKRDSQPLWLMPSLP